ncbi:Uncharacterized protein FWK35_00021600 [Aphis craccivora]|uniref:Uncharacterized protein n=1 Tax=Aphis craccivora TaxID=307492 RepID=A0A6G0YT70_APHCR|nr:Uncharacterized protein FWK35_00021600 [Aphis craccivora]
MFGRRGYDDDTCGGEQSPPKRTPENSSRTEQPPRAVAVAAVATTTTTTATPTEQRQRKRMKREPARERASERRGNG